MKKKTKQKQALAHKSVFSSKTKQLSSNSHTPDWNMLVLNGRAPRRDRRRFENMIFENVIGDKFQQNHHVQA